jgi:hypothetical protein
MAQNIDEKRNHLDAPFPNEIEEYHSETNTAVDADSLGKSQGGFGESNANAVDVDGTLIHLISYDRFMSESQWLTNCLQTLSISLKSSSEN